MLQSQRFVLHMWSDVPETKRILAVRGLEGSRDSGGKLVLARFSSLLLTQSSTLSPPRRRGYLERRRGQRATWRRVGLMAILGEAMKEAELQI